MDISKELQNKYRKKIYGPFIRAINKYQLIKDGDKVMVCISGGKDSYLLACCLKVFQKYGPIKFDVEYIVMNPGYKESVLNKIIENSKILDIPIKIYNSDIFSVSTKLAPDKPCYMCARMRRGFLYSKATELGCNKMALGHHFDDVISTTMMSMFYNGEFKTMLPKLNSTNFKNIKLIRPLYFVREKDIINFSTNNDLKFINCACSFTERDDYETASKRKEIRNFIEKYKLINPNIDKNIFRSLEKVQLDTILSYVENNEEKTKIDYNSN